MKKYQLFLFAIFLISCTNNDPSNNKSNENHIDFSNLQVGQKTSYLVLQGERYHENDNSDFEYTGDTLQVKIIDENDGIFTILEHFSNNELESLTSLWEIENNRLIASKIQETQGIGMYLMGHNEILELELFTDATKMEIFGWKTDFGYCECDQNGIVHSYSLFNHSYQNLNVIIHNSPMQVDANGNTVVYSKNDGIVKKSNYSWWTQSGVGYDKIL